MSFDLCFCFKITIIYFYYGKLINRLEHRRVIAGKTSSTSYHSLLFQVFLNYLIIFLVFYKPLPHRTNLMLTQRFGIQLIIDSTGFCINTFGSYRLPTQFDMYNITLRVFFNKNAKKKRGRKIGCLNMSNY